MQSRGGETSQQREPSSWRAKTDFARVAQLEPTNRDARLQLQRAKERLSEIRQREKELFAGALNGGLYQDQHVELDRRRQQYEEDMELRREELGAGHEISFEVWQEKARKAQEEAEANDERRRWLEENERLRLQGDEELSFEEFRQLEAQERAAAECRRPHDVVDGGDVELEEEERKLLEEIGEKGYYHGRLNTVLSDAAPKPQRVASEVLAENTDSPIRSAGSEWNEAGTWEEKDMTPWAKDKLKELLLAATARSPSVRLPSGETAAVSASVTEVSSLTGDAQIVMVRKKRRHGFTFEAQLAFKVAVGTSSAGKPGGSFTGTIVLPEIADAALSGDMRIGDPCWGDKEPPERLLTVAAVWADNLCKSIRDQVAAFGQEYRQK
eukprot:gnl/TRDRNA2_/TRDRNA2_136404_c0_seq1.p1 gnl/TRDRNA2_/TRDRNA2_136404_c0~~gnl/TRDRNA2_/TRDRNA2_136404_c0_seq1.p1  ORF type:complete len:383 (-),score=111.54 gnl/TRDRNA2_/TRDRNA2_136404_c0_seq1:58-1206(-)